MIGLIQRVKQASVVVDGHCVGSINAGLLLFLGVEKTDSNVQVEKLAKKVLSYRVFSDDAGKMNLSLKDVGGELLVVSQFTLVAQTNKGNRPGFSEGASPEHGEAIYNAFIKHVNDHYMQCASGIFGADMQVNLLNDGPVTFHFKV